MIEWSGAQMCTDRQELVKIIHMHGDGIGFMSVNGTLSRKWLHSVNCHLGMGICPILCAMCIYVFKVQL